jgi:hypothetical protein
MKMKSRQELTKMKSRQELAFAQCATGPPGVRNLALREHWIAY